MIFSLKGGLLKDTSLLPARDRFEPHGERAPVLLRALFTGVRGETVRKGVRTTLLAWIWEAQGDQNGSKSTVSVLRKATPQAPPTLFGQSRKGHSRKFAVANSPAWPRP